MDAIKKIVKFMQIYISALHLQYLLRIKKFYHWITIILKSDLCTCQRKSPSRTDIQLFMILLFMFTIRLDLGEHVSEVATVLAWLSF